MDETGAAMVIIFLWFGGMKFTAYEAAGIAPFIEHSPIIHEIKLDGYRMQTGSLAVVGFLSSWFCSRHPPCSQPASQRRSNAVTVASNFGLRYLRRDQPSPESVALKVLGSAHAGRPTR
jgi:hypothetical protein